MVYGLTRKIGIIAGSGVDGSLFGNKLQTRNVRTPYGTVPAKTGVVDGQAVVYLNRHGRHYCAPHEINFRGNLWALRSLGVSDILATAAVGSLVPKMKPGDFVLPDDFLDFTSRRIEYFDPHANTDMTTPYDRRLRTVIERAAAGLAPKLHRHAVYVCVEGPRFESKAEIRLFRGLGGDVVGMTQVPEVVLAAELGIPYAVVGVITNMGAGMAAGRISTAEVIRMMHNRTRLLSRLLNKIISGL